MLYDIETFEITSIKRIPIHVYKKLLSLYSKKELRNLFFNFQDNLYNSLFKMKTSFGTSVCEHLIRNPGMGIPFMMGIPIIKTKKHKHIKKPKEFWKTKNYNYKKELK